MSKRHAVDGADPADPPAEDAVSDREVDLEVLDGQQRPVSAACGVAPDRRRRRAPAALAVRLRWSRSIRTRPVHPGRSSTTTRGPEAAQAGSLGSSGMPGDGLLRASAGCGRRRSGRVQRRRPRAARRRRARAAGRPSSMRSSRHAQRGANGQPTRSAARSGGEPSIGRQRRLARPVEARQRAEQADRVRVGRVGEDRLGGAELDEAARVHDREPIGEARPRRPGRG